MHGRMLALFPVIVFCLVSRPRVYDLFGPSTITWHTADQMLWSQLALFPVIVFCRVYVEASESYDHLFGPSTITWHTADQMLWLYACSIPGHCILPLVEAQSL
jgi:hypothetical protein